MSDLIGRRLSVSHKASPKTWSSGATTWSLNINGTWYNFGTEPPLGTIIIREAEEKKPGQVKVKSFTLDADAPAPASTSSARPVREDADRQLCIARQSGFRDFVSLYSTVYAAQPTLSVQEVAEVVRQIIVEGIRLTNDITNFTTGEKNG